MGTHRRASSDLATLLCQMAIETLADALPGAALIEVLGEFNEDWGRTVRTQRVLDAEGVVLFEVGAGHPDRMVEDAVDTVDI